MRGLAHALLALGLAACGGGASIHPGDAAPSAAGVCGTHTNPGILKLTNVAPAPGTTVYNQAIVHGFTVVNAPALFSNFELDLGAAHTAGLPTPERPKFQLTQVGSDVIYQLTILSWSRSPGHVELLASGGYDTLAGCSWSFPTPLFAYDVVGEPDGGASPEAGGALDGAANPIDSTLIPVFHLDAPLQFDAPAAIDAPDQPIDGAIDAPGLPLDAEIDL